MCYSYWYVCVVAHDRVVLITVALAVGKDRMGQDALELVRLLGLIQR